MLQSVTGVPGLAARVKVEKKKLRSWNEVVGWKAFFKIIVVAESLLFYPERARDWLNWRVQ